MFRFILKRFVAMLPVLAIVLVVTFLAIHALPSDPVQVMLSDHSSNVELANRLRAEYGLDQPLWRQFAHYALGVLHGDFGLSFHQVGVPVIEVLRDALMISPLLAVAAVTLAFPIGLLGGSVAAIWRNTVIDTAVMLALV